VTKASSPHNHSSSPSSSPVVSPADGECSAQSEPMDCMPATPPAADSSRQRKEEPKQTPLPLDKPASPRGFKPKNSGKPQASPSTEGIPPWLWEG
jgi:hypothetical protein